MKDDSRSRRAGKARPTPLGLQPHATGKYYKKIKGQFKYFGRVGEPEAADELYRQWIVSTDQNQTPATPPADITLAELADRFITHTEARANDGEIEFIHYQDYRKCVLDFIAFTNLGGHRAETLPAEKFKDYRRHLRGKFGGHRANLNLTAVRAMFRWAFEVVRPQLIRYAIHRDVSLRKIPKRFIRREQGQREAKHGKPLFSPREVRILIKYARGQMRSMILLAVNCAMTQRDIGELKWSDLKLKTGYLDYTRHKTEILRQAWLWPETVKSLIAVRDDPKRTKFTDKAHADRVFVTRWGKPFWYEVKREKPTKKGGMIARVEHISSEFRKFVQRIDARRLAKAIEAGGEPPKPLWKTGRNFRALRRTFRTVVEGSNISPRRLNTIRRIMGHDLTGNDPHYLRAMPLRRLKEVGQYLGQRILKNAEVPPERAETDNSAQSRHAESPGNDAPPAGA